MIGNYQYMVIAFLIGVIEECLSSQIFKSIYNIKQPLQESLLQRLFYLYSCFNSPNSFHNLFSVRPLFLRRTALQNRENTKSTIRRCVVANRWMVKLNQQMRQIHPIVGTLIRKNQNEIMGENFLAETQKIQNPPYYGV